jgi:hypothetical protein
LQGTAHAVATGHQGPHRAPGLAGARFTECLSNDSDLMISQDQLYKLENGRFRSHSTLARRIEGVLDGAPRGPALEQRSFV